MNIWWLLGIELFLTTATISLLWGLSVWRRRKNHAKNMAQLLETLEKAEIQRSEIYHQWLKEHHHLSEEDTLLLVNAWLESEKKYWREFLIWQLNPGTQGLLDLVRHLHSLIDERLASTAQMNPTAPAEEESQPEPRETAPTEEIQIAPPDEEDPLSENNEGPTVLSDAPAEDAVQVSSDSLQEALAEDTTQGVLEDDELVILSDTEDDEESGDQDTSAGDEDTISTEPVQEAEAEAEAEADNILVADKHKDQSGPDPQ